MTSSPKRRPPSKRWTRTCNPPPCPPSLCRNPPDTNLLAPPRRHTHSKSRDLAQLSALGHFLKGSSATLGLTKVKDSCEKIQHFGAHKDETGTHDEPDEDVCLKKCETQIQQAKTEFKEVESALKKFYHDEEDGEATSTAAAAAAAAAAEKGH